MDEFEVHNTIVNTSGLPPGVINHGIVTPQQYADLLAQSKVRITDLSILEENIPPSTNYTGLLNYDSIKLDLI